jgi:hypothetical protein
MPKMSKKRVALEREARAHQNLIVFKSAELYFENH